MAKANRCFTGSRQSVGTPTLNKNSYHQLIRKIRKAREEHPIGSAGKPRTVAEK